MKILNIVGSLDQNAGGPSRSVPQTCVQVSELDVAITLVARPSEQPVVVDTSENLKFLFKTIIELFSFGRSITSKEYDIIHLQHIWDPYIHVIAFWARRKGIPYIITPRGMLEPWIMNHNPWKKKLGMLLYQKKDLQKAKVIHATCELEKTNIRNLGFMNPITIIPNGVDVSKFPVNLPEKINKPKRILFLSRIHQKKGIEFLIEAWSQLNQRIRKGWLVEVIGNGERDYIESLQKKITSLNLETQIHIKPPVFGEDKITAFREASLFVLPTYSENFGIVVAEALASYTPVITTKGTPWQELNTNNCGWWIKVGTEPLKIALQEAMQKSPQEIQLMGLNGRKLVEENYDVKVVAQNMTKLYQKILDK